MNQQTWLGLAISAAIALGGSVSPALAEPEIVPEILPASDLAQRRGSGPPKRLTGYGGIGGGFFFPTEDDDTLDNAFGGSLFIGDQVDDNLGLELEFVVFGGDTEANDEDYTLYGLFANSRIIAPLGGGRRARIIFYFAPGLGFVDGETDAAGLGIEDTEFALQGKLGLDFKLSRSVGVFIQGRYILVTSEGSPDFISPEAGVQLRF